MTVKSLPVVGNSNGTWGTILNEFLSENVFTLTGYLKDPVLVSVDIQHLDDSDTYIRFTEDEVGLTVGDVKLLQAVESVESGEQTAFWVNPDGEDVNFIVGDNWLFVDATGINVVGLVECDSFRIDQTPATESLSCNKSITISCNGVSFKIPCVAA